MRWSQIEDTGGDPRDAPLTFFRPAWRETVADECRAVRDRVGLVDLSAFAKFDVAGPDATAFVERLGANRPPREIGRIGLTHVLTEAGVDPTPAQVRRAWASMVSTMETAPELASLAVRVCGGRSLLRPHTLERLYRDARALWFEEGTAEIQKLVVGSAVASGRLTL